MELGVRTMGAESFGMMNVVDRDRQICDWAYRPLSPRSFGNENCLPSLR
jgi:hypothetical protein